MDTATEPATIRTVHPNLRACLVRGAWLTPQETATALATGAAYDVTRVQWVDGGESWAKCWYLHATRQSETTGYRIGAGAYGDLTVLETGR